MYYILNFGEIDDFHEWMTFIKIRNVFEHLT